MSGILDGLGGFLGGALLGGARVPSFPAQGRTLHDYLGLQPQPWQLDILRQQMNRQNDFQQMMLQPMVIAARDLYVSSHGTHELIPNRFDRPKRFPLAWQFKSGSIARMTYEAMVNRLADADAPRVYRAWDRSLGEYVHYEAR